MKDSLIYRTDATLIVTILFILMLVLIYAGAKLSGKRKKISGNESADSTIISAVLTLFGFLLAFSFSMSGRLERSPAGIRPRKDLPLRAGAMRP